jgi:hypothetical protein
MCVSTWFLPCFLAFPGCRWGASFYIKSAVLYHLSYERVVGTLSTCQAAETERHAENVLAIARCCSTSMAWPGKALCEPPEIPQNFGENSWRLQWYVR